MHGDPARRTDKKATFFMHATAINEEEGEGEAEEEGAGGEDELGVVVAAEEEAYEELK